MCHVLKRGQSNTIEVVVWGVIPEPKVFPPGSLILDFNGSSHNQNLELCPSNLNLKHSGAFTYQNGLDYRKPVSRCKCPCI